MHLPNIFLIYISCFSYTFMLVEHFSPCLICNQIQRIFLRYEFSNDISLMIQESKFPSMCPVWRCNCWKYCTFISNEYNFEVVTRQQTKSARRFLIRDWLFFYSLTIVELLYWYVICNSSTKFVQWFIRQFNNPISPTVSVVMLRILCICNG